MIDSILLDLLLAMNLNSFFDPLMLPVFTEPFVFGRTSQSIKPGPKFPSQMAWLLILEIDWPHWFLARTGSIELTLSRRNNKNSSQSFIRRIVMGALSVKTMAEIQRRIRFNTISMSVLMITIAVGVMTAMWMYADSVV